MKFTVFGAAIIAMLLAAAHSTAALAQDSTVSASGQAKCENLAKSFPAYGEYVKYKNLLGSFQQLTYEDSQMQDNLGVTYRPYDDDSDIGRLRESYQGCISAQTVQTQNGGSRSR